MIKRKKKQKNDTVNCFPCTNIGKIREELAIRVNMRCVRGKLIMRAFADLNNKIRPRFIFFSAGPRLSGFFLFFFLLLLLFSVVEKGND